MLLAPILDIGEPGCRGRRSGCGNGRAAAGIGLCLKSIVFGGQGADFRLRLLRSLLNQLISVALTQPCLEPRCECAMLPGGKDCDLSIAMGLAVVRLHRSLVLGQLYLKLRSVVAGGPL